MRSLLLIVSRSARRRQQLSTKPLAYAASQKKRFSGPYFRLLKTGMKPSAIPALVSDTLARMRMPCLAGRPIHELSLRGKNAWRWPLP
jgi:hypothetical protein